MRRLIPIFTLLIVAGLAAAPVWGPGLVNTRGGGDSPFLLQRTHQMVENLRAGVFPVRWAPDAAYELGYPFFSYYAALPYYLAGGLVLLGVDILTALKITQTLGFWLAALAMYGWMRSETGHSAVAWLAAVAYTVAPFHLVNVYVRGDSLSEFWAFVWYPLILWGGGSENRQSPCVALALAYAGLLLTHNISAFIFSPFILLYLLVRWARREMDGRSLARAWGALALGFALAAWFWLPAVAELRYVQLGPSTQDYFHYSRHFRAANLVQWTPLFDYSIAPVLNGRSPFAMGLAQAVCAVLGVVAMVRARATAAAPLSRATRDFILLGLIASTGMITPLSKPVWDHLPLLPVVQFPWRFLSVQALFTAAVTGQIAYRRARGAYHHGLAAICLVASALGSLRPERLPIGPADVTSGRLGLYELFTGNIGTTIRYEWLPRTAHPRPYTSGALLMPDEPPRAIPLDGAALAATLVERRPTLQVWRVEGAGGDVAFPLLYWPGWQARIDESPTAVWPAEGSGYLALTLPAGAHIVTLSLGRTPLRAVSETISLCAALLTLTLTLVRRPRFSLSPRLLVFLSPCLLVLFVLFPSRDFPAGSDLTMDFHTMPYLHHNPDGIVVGETRLEGYTLAAEKLAPGETLTVTLDPGQTEGAPPITLEFVSPAAVRYDVEPLARCTASGMECRLRLPEDIPRGLYLLRLGDQYLRPVWVTRGPALPDDAPTLARFGAAITLHGATITQPAPGRLAVQLDWSAARPIVANYAISLRLLDSAGQMRLSFDTQPGYGFLPTSLWMPGERIADRYTLALPADLPGGEGYRLWIVLYQAATLAPVGQVQVGDFALPLNTPFVAQPILRSFVLPPLDHSLNVDFGAQIRLAGYELTQTPAALHLTLWWQALRAPESDYTVFVHLCASPGAPPVVQSDAPPRGGAYPTSWWVMGEVVSETVTLSVSDAPAGRYRLAVGLYDPATARLPAVAPDGQRITDDRPILSEEVQIP